ncbi:MAG TPA: shikimate dehydrogenase [Microvirga sp.]|jgi:shikimate dehydrogenase
MRKAFVVGHPIKHSRSPLIHGHWLEHHGIAGSYERIDVAPEAFRDFLGTLNEQGFVGGNVTIPHKETAFAAVERRTSRAERLQAVNTVWMEDGVLWGDNTDGMGFMANLDQALGAGWDEGRRNALVLGAGGAARAVVAGLAARGFAVSIVNRTPSKAEEVARMVGGTTLPWTALPEALPGADLVVNTTSLGMAGQPPLDIDLSRAPLHAVVTDIVYVPLTTPFLAAAAARGLRTVDGLGMLLHQAVPGFARWFGVTPSVTPALRDLVLADLGGRA